MLRIVNHMYLHLFTALFLTLVNKFHYVMKQR